MKIRIVIISIVFNAVLCAQKPPIDIAALNSGWPSVGNPSISPNGDYVSYVVRDQPQGNHTLFVVAADFSWKKEFIGATQSYFSEDNKLFIFQNGDTLCLLKLGTGQFNKIAGVNNIRYPKNAKGALLAYQFKTDPKTLIIRNLISGDEQKFSNVAIYTFIDPIGKNLLFQNDSLRWVNLDKGTIHTIWSGKGEASSISSYNFDAQGEQIAFIVKPNTSIQADAERKGNSIWYYRLGMEKAIRLVDDQQAGIASNLIISSSSLFFSFNGEYISFKLKHVTDTRKPNPDAVPVDIWHYKDLELQCVQPRRQEPEFIATVSVKGGRVIILGEKVVLPPSEANANYAIVVDEGVGRQWWQKKNYAYSLISLKDGSRKLITTASKFFEAALSISSGGKYLIYFDAQQRHYFSYELYTGLTRNISNRITQRLDDENVSTYYWKVVGIAGWLKKDIGVLVYDNYDIWQLDPAGKQSPINITNGYGRLHNIKFRLVYPNRETGNIGDVDTLLLTAFNVQTKYNGFYHCISGKSTNPKKLTMGPFNYYRVDSQSPFNGDAFSQGMKPLKAGGANTWMIQRESPTKAPNYFLTSDFIEFKTVTDIQPQTKYNWLTTELITWKQLDGTLSQGVLYKPQDFNPSKKYPVILTYYQSFSHRMYEYPYPDFTKARIDIAWFVSHGYLVFTPDIHYSIANVSGKTAGDAAVNSVESAAKYLARLPYVDPAKMGIQGHSFGGYETNFIITRTKIFAAACEASGTSNVISGYLGVVREFGKPNGDKQGGYESGQGRIGATLWQRPDLYIQYSPIFKANQIVTPLLIMHNQGDASIDWNQGVEMYMALRRLEKKVWMLQYDGTGHVLRGKSAIDFTIRMQQFFNHYLKNAPAPIWMSRGIPARLKGIETGYAYDPSGTCGMDCKVCKIWNEKMTIDSVTTTQEIESGKKQEHWQ